VAAAAGSVVATAAAAAAAGNANDNSHACQASDRENSPDLSAKIAPKKAKKAKIAKTGYL